LPTRQVKSQPLDEPLEFNITCGGLCLTHHGAKRVNHDDARTGCLDLFDNLLQHRVQVVIEHNLAEVDEADRGIQLGLVEKLKLLLIPQHLDGRFAQHGEVKRGTVRGGIGEHDLMGEGGLPAAGLSRDEVKRKLR
jgi:hypothetical protein